jgi:hypothetical protein
MRRLMRQWVGGLLKCSGPIESVKAKPEISTGHLHHNVQFDRGESPIERWSRTA